MGWMTVDNTTAGYTAKPLVQGTTPMNPYEQATSDLAKRVAGVGGSAGGGLTQSNTAGINLETGMPINGAPSLTGNNGPSNFYAGVPGNTAGGSGGGSTSGSSSDAFFASANAPMQTRTASMMPNTANATAGYNTKLLNDLIAQFRQQSTAANHAGEKQYNNLLNTVSGAKSDVAGLFSQLGKTGETRIAQNQAQARGHAEQDLINRGLGNTTIRQNVLGGVDRDAEQARQQLNEGIAAQKIGSTMNLAQMYGDALLSKQNVGPDPNMLNIIQQLGSMGGTRR